LSKWWGFLAR